MDVEISETNCWSVRFVSKMEIERMDSSRVFGIFCASEMCRSAVVRLSYIIVCRVGIRFLVSRK